MMVPGLRTLVPVVTAAFLAGVADADRAQGSAGSAQASALRARGLELGYNLDHQQALETFRQAIAADPAHPAAHRLVAATMWISVLLRHGAVTAEDFLGQADSSAAMRPKAEDLDQEFRRSLDTAIALAGERLRQAGPRDADAHFQLGAAYGFLATYTATIQGSLTSALGPSRRAYSEHERVLALDPSRKEAGLIVGLYRYGVSELPVWSRLIANLAGFGGGRDRGIRLVEDAASHASDVQTNARFALIVIYNREQRYADATRLIRQLQQQFPRNRLLWLEEAGTAIRAGQHAQARAALEAGLAKLAADPRPRAFGEIARWRYLYGASLAGVGLTDQASTELRAALIGDGHAWVRGRVHLELGRLAVRSADGNAAADLFRRAAELCTEGRDTTCAREARRLASQTRRSR
jgi:tetratricopeptide (TPR) repeat protein